MENADAAKLGMGDGKLCSRPGLYCSQETSVPQSADNPAVAATISASASKASVLANEAVLSESTFKPQL